MLGLKPGVIVAVSYSVSFIKNYPSTLYSVEYVLNNKKRILAIEANDIINYSIILELLYA